MKNTSSKAHGYRTLKGMAVAVVFCLIFVVFLTSQFVKLRDAFAEKTVGSNETRFVDDYSSRTNRDKANNVSTPLRSLFSAQLLDKLGDLRGDFTGTLKPHADLVVPNIAHYIWFSCHAFEFENLLSMVSVHRFMKADKILFHTDCEPSGPWWSEAKMIPNLEIVPRKPLTKIFGKIINPDWPEHQSDVARLQILMDHGGGYLDTDIFVLKPLQPLRYYDYVVGRQTSRALNNGIILASKDSEFLRIFYESYRNYNPTCYSCTSISNHNDLAEQNQELVHIENYSLVQPNFDRWRTIFYGKFDWRDGHYTIHLWIKQFKNKNKGFSFNKENIKMSDTAFGEMCRYIYYGTSELIDSNTTTAFEWWRD